MCLYILYVGMALTEVLKMELASQLDYVNVQCQCFAPNPGISAKEHSNLEYTDKTNKVRLNRHLSIVALITVIDSEP